MTSAKDGVLPVIAAAGTPAQLSAAEAPSRSLTSDSTRRAGVVSSIDLAPTLHAQAAGSSPGATSASTGAVMRAVEDAAPLGLHARYLDMRRMTVPLQTAALVYVVVSVSALVALLARDVAPHGSG
jgi:hypothetical protein